MKFAKFSRTPVFTEYLQWLLQCIATLLKPCFTIVYYRLGPSFVPPYIKVNFPFYYPTTLFMTPSIFIGSQKN